MLSRVTVQVVWWRVYQTRDRHVDTDIRNDDGVAWHAALQFESQ